MGNMFAGSEVVEIGIQIEKNGKEFYDAVSLSSKDTKAKEVFKFLSQEEERHIAVFKKMQESVEQYEPAESYPGEYFAYMNALAGNHIFTQKDKGREIARTIKNEKEAVELGIGFEKDSIIFYEGMKRLVPDYDAKIIDELIGQEKAHLVKLTELKAQL